MGSGVYADRRGASAGEPTVVDSATGRPRGRSNPQCRLERRLACPKLFGVSVHGLDRRRFDGPVRGVGLSKKSSWPVQGGRLAGSNGLSKPVATAFARRFQTGLLAGQLGLSKLEGVVWPVQIGPVQSGPAAQSTARTGFDSTVRSVALACPKSIYGPVRSVGLSKVDLLACPRPWPRPPPVGSGRAIWPGDLACPIGRSIERGSGLPLRCAFYPERGPRDVRRLSRTHD
jgi:hypothetical protein